MDQKTILKRKGNYEITEMSDGVVIQQNDVVHTLNATAFEIFELCDGKRTIKDIIDEMKNRYSREDIEAVTTDFLDQLKNSGLIEM